MSNQASFKASSSPSWASITWPSTILVFRPLLAAWQEYTGAEIEWIDLPQAEIFPRIQQKHLRAARSILTFSKEGPRGRAISWAESRRAGAGLVGAAIAHVRLRQTPPGASWHVERRDVPVSTRCDAHNFNFRSDIFSNEELGAEWTASGGSQEWGPPQTWQQVQVVTSS